MSDVNAKEASSAMPAEHVSMRTKLSYGFGGFGKDFSLALVNTFLFFYLTDVAHVSAVAVGIIFLVARIWDTVNDPIFGYIVAKTNSRWGKYKPWIFVGNILSCIFMTACFATHYFEGTFQLVWLTVTYIAWGMAYTICDAPFWSLIPTITLDQHEREGLLPYPRFAASIGNYAASGLGVYAVYLFGQGDEGFGYMIYALLGGITAVASALVTCKWTEQNYEESGGDEFSIKEAIFIIKNNKQFLIFITLALCYVIGTGLMNNMNLYVFKYVLNDEKAFSTMMLFSTIIAFPALIFFKPLVNFFGRRTIFICAIGSPFIMGVAIALAGYGLLPNAIAVPLAGLLNGFSNALYWLLVMIMVADTVDYGDYQFGIRSECIYYSFNTLVAKCSGAIASFVIGIFLSMINYVPNVEQSESTINGLILLYLIPSFFCVIGMLIYIFIYKLNGKTLDEIQQALMRKYMDKLVKTEAAKEPSQAEIELKG